MRSVARVYIWIFACVLAIQSAKLVDLWFPGHPGIGKGAFIVAAFACAYMALDALRSLRRGNWLVKKPTWEMIVTVLAVVSTGFALMALMFHMSPTLSISIMADILPADIQDAIFYDFLLRGGSGFWMFAIVAFVLWMVRAHIRDSR